ncbi:MAG: hypothetical protein H6863_06565, partial [Rhodospirillales bacterium]|nr:hypothetical protein [Rhodospirillales bacterium]
VLIADTDREHYTQIPLSEIVKAIQDENYVGEKRSYLDVWQAAGHSLLWKFYHSEDGKDERAVPS